MSSKDSDRSASRKGSAQMYDRPTGWRAVPTKAIVMGLLAAAAAIGGTVFFMSR